MRQVVLKDIKFPVSCAFFFFFPAAFPLFFCDKGEGFTDAEMVYNCLI